MITGDFCIQMTCPGCGADLALITQARPASREHTSIWRCLECRKQWSARIDIVPFSLPRDLPSATFPAVAVAKTGADNGR